MEHLLRVEVGLFREGGILRLLREIKHLKQQSPDQQGRGATHQEDFVPSDSQQIPPL